MRPSRLALLHLVLGAWLAISGATIAGAVLSFREAPASEAAISGDDAARGGRLQAMRFNRAMFEASSRAQVVLAIFALMLAAWAPIPSRGALAAVILAAVLAGILAFAVTPRSSAIADARIGALASGSIVPPDAAQDARFRGLHRAYAVLDLCKSALLVGAGWATVRAATRRG